MAVLGVAAVGIHFGVALTAGSQVQTARYALAFVCGMSYNVAAVAIVAVLLARLAVHGAGRTQCACLKGAAVTSATEALPSIGTLILPRSAFATRQPGRRLF